MSTFMKSVPRSFINIIRYCADRRCDFENAARDGSGFRWCRLKSQKRERSRIVLIGIRYFVWLYSWVVISWWRTTICKAMDYKFSSKGLFIAWTRSWGTRAGAISWKWLVHVNYLMYSGVFSHCYLANFQIIYPINCINRLIILYFNSTKTSCCLGLVFYTVWATPHWNDETLH